MFELRIGYPTAEEEQVVANLPSSGAPGEVSAVVTAEELLDFQALIQRIPVSASIIEYAVRIARCTRPREDSAPDFIRKMVSWGAGPRASQHTVLAAKGRAALQGRPVHNLDDVRAVAPDVLRHRIVPGFEAEAEGRTADDIVAELIEHSRSW